MSKFMLQRGVGIALFIGVAVSATFAAPGQGQFGRGMGGQQGMGGGQFGQFGQGMGGQMGGLDLSSILAPSAIQKRMLDYYKEQLAPTEEEWTVLEPRLAKVLELSEGTNSLTGMITQVVDRFRRSQWAQDQMQGQENKTEEEEKSAVQKAMTELQETLDKEAPSTVEIKAKMLALRGAREKVKQQLVKAEDELREVLTLKQEATLLMLGLLE